LDIYLAKILSNALPQLANGAGYVPLNDKDEWDEKADATRWRAILMEMAEGFTLDANRWEWDLGKEADTNFEKVNRSYELLAKWHNHLWD
jgi:hypothetical protein